MPLKPRALKPGDTVALVSPASPISREKTAGMVSLLEAEGYKVVFGPHCFDEDFFLAGSDQDRAADLMWAFQDDSVDAVLCSRGGYGCARLLPHLDFDAMVASRKLFAGFSDITTLHLALNRRGFATLHAPMALTFNWPREEWIYESFRRALRGQDSVVSEAPKGTCLVPGSAEGEVIGGCLCLLTDSIGTQEALDPTGKLLIIEDVDENPHRIDAMLTQMLNTGLAQKAAGFVIGEMTRTDEKVDEGIGGRPWREIVKDRLGRLGIPAVVDFPFGHGKNILSLPLGIRARLDADAGTLTYLENLCD